MADPVLADSGPLVAFLGRHDRARVFTLDADFKLYRRHRRQTIPLIHPAP